VKHAREIVVAAFLIGIVVGLRAFPRYEWRDSKRYRDALIRIDRWTGEAQFGVVDAKWGRWVSIWELRADSRGKRSTLQTNVDDAISEIDIALNDAAAPRHGTSELIAGGSLLVWAAGVACGWIARDRLRKRIHI